MNCYAWGELLEAFLHPKLYSYFNAYWSDTMCGGGGMVPYHGRTVAVLLNGSGLDEREYACAVWMGYAFNRPAFLQRICSCEEWIVPYGLACFLSLDHRGRLEQFTF